ncbi:MAG: hypothetical protein KC502_15215 [Myxococcales bacterium]|nr:hypothetical protein [Myxococcales bacterium]
MSARKGKSKGRRPFHRIRDPAKAPRGDKERTSPPEESRPAPDGGRSGTPAPRAQPPRAQPPRAQPPRTPSSRKSPRTPPPLPPTGWIPDVSALVGPIKELAAERYTPARMRGQKVPLAEIHRDGLRMLNKGFTSDRDDRNAGYLSGPRARGAYLVYYTFTGAATVQSVLRQADLRGAWNDFPTDRPLRVLDLGAGPLTATLGLATAWPDIPLDVTAVDGAKAALNDGAALLEAIRPGTKVRLEAGNLRNGKLRQRLGSDYDVVLLANVLNEFPETVRRERTRGEDSGESPAQRLLRDVLENRLAPGGRVVIVETGQRASSRLLIALRDSLIAGEQAEVIAPCLGAVTCPLGAAHSRDWCHADQPWRRPRPVAALDRMLSRRRDTLKFSYLVLSRPGEGAPPARDTWRLIGGPMGRPGMTTRRYACGPTGRIVCVDERGSTDFHDIPRGDLLIASGEPRKGGPRGEMELRVGRNRQGGSR